MTFCLFEHNRNQMFWLHNNFDFNLVVQVLDNEPFHSNSWGSVERYGRALAWMDPVASDAVNACPDTVASAPYLRRGRIVSRSHSGSRPPVWKHPYFSWQIWALRPEAFWYGRAACVPCPAPSGNSNQMSLWVWHGGLIAAGPHWSRDSSGNQRIYTLLDIT